MDLLLMFGCTEQPVDGMLLLLFESNMLTASSSFSLASMQTLTIFTGGKSMEACLKSTRLMAMKVDFILEHLMTTIFTDLMLISMKTTILDGKEDGKLPILQPGFGKLVGVVGTMTSFGVKLLQSLNLFSGLLMSILKTATILLLILTMAYQKLNTFTIETECTQLLYLHTEVLYLSLLKHTSIQQFLMAISILWEVWSESSSMASME